MGLDDLISGAIGAAIVAAFNFIKWLIERKDTKEDKSFDKALNRITDVYNAMNMLLRYTRAVRVLVLRAEDSGKIPEAGKDLFSSVVHEVYDDSSSSCYDKWRKQHLDSEYVKILTRVSAEGSAKVVIQDLKSCAWRNLYLSDGIACSYLFRLYARPAQFFYLSVSFVEVVDLTTQEQDAIRVVVNRLSRIFTLQDRYSGKDKK